MGEASKAMEAAAKAICAKLPGIDESDCVQNHARTGNYANQPPCVSDNCLSAEIARAAILAFLDAPETASAVKAALYGYSGQAFSIDEVIAALRAQAAPSS